MVFPLAETRALRAGLENIVELYGFEREPRLWHRRQAFQMLKRLAVTCAMALLAVPSVAQPPASTPISGVVVDADSRAPIQNATVSAGAARVSADAAGRFTLQVEGRRVTLLVEASGYFALTTTLEIPEAGLSGAELALARETPFAASVAVTGSAPSVAPATVVVPPVQVLRTPGALDNVYRTLQTLPGVAAIEEFGSRLAAQRTIGASVGGY